MLPCLAGFASLFGRIISLFGGLGNFSARGSRINGLARRIRPPRGALSRFCQYFPAEQRIQRAAPMSRRQKPCGQSMQSIAA